MIPHQRSGRDLRLDLFRGLSLIFIFVDHVPDNVLSYLTLQSFSFCDAAEVFIFISGYAAAIVYGKALQRRGSIIATAQIYRRVWQLYATSSIGSTPPPAATSRRQKRAAKLAIASDAGRAGWRLPR